ncbi:pseudouridine synthase [Shewanella surugensis]|uniref:Pseudouridine synthase n=1 Tax=Shewanella surugensis TaxID=212020 RepID=A0ABT0L8R8_9GAMM|nr:pseudouridine synthase [Shewanella surugensis]MCL1124097.1 pseudouridine synthase [Shewanella surugensis]
MRLAQYLAMTGLCSRRAATRYIRDGRIMFNARLANHTDAVILIKQNDPKKAPLIDDVILCDNQAIPNIETKSYWLFHKAVGTDSRLLKDDPNSLLHLLPTSPRLYPVGRLDKDSRGLLLLTNDGALTHQLSHPDFGHKKAYHVQLSKPFNDAFIISMASGVHYKGIVTLPCQINRLDSTKFEIILTQGLNRQIRRMSQALGYHVIDLKRVSIQGLSLGNLPEGEKRQLTQEERSCLTNLLSLNKSDSQ